ncbi:neutral endopeptidase [Aplysia californica]|uniref:Neutral endopeptidase n=1 Tax=Aplysia californica TaxID=6500 RepID=Q9UA44_APLCA|nr:neutral endopeptidase [Aplysia californica]AAD51382.1 neutral endopeptidase [Aplysia californica]
MAPEIPLDIQRLQFQRTTSHWPEEQKSKAVWRLIALLVVLVLALVAIVVLSIVIVRIREDNKTTVKPEPSSGSDGTTSAASGSGGTTSAASGSGGTTSADSDGKICVHEGCVTAAARIMSNLDKSVHPCDNFYNFACANWEYDRDIPKDSAALSVLSELGKKVDRQVKLIIEAPSPPDELPVVTKAKNLYKSCLDLETMDARGIDPYKQWLSSTIGEWPLISSAFNESEFDITDAIRKANIYGPGPVVAFYVGTDDKNSSKKILKIDQPAFGLPGQRYYRVPRNDTYIKAYETYLYRVAEALGFADPATAEKDVADVVDFEMQIAQISVRPAIRRNANAVFNPMTLAELDQDFSSPELNFSRLITTVMSAPEVAVSVGDDEIIMNRSPPYFRNLTDLLRNTPKKTIANYIIWRITISYLGTLTQVFKDIRFEFTKAIYGIETVQPRELFCTSFVRRNVGFIISKPFVDKFFSPEAKDVALEMISGLQSAFNEIVDEVEWMDEETKVVAREKNDAIVSKIGYPEFVINSTRLTELYENYTYGNDTYFENILSKNKVNVDSSFRSLRELVDKEQWFRSPPTVNAYYNKAGNEIVFPAGILQSPVFHVDFPKYLNYGSIGVIIGHEITHGFDDKGRLYDKNGNLNQWWSNSAIEKFNTQKQCIIDQYGAYVMDQVELNLNGIRTQGENIADNGVSKSLSGRTKLGQSTRKEEPTLPGLQYTNDQLFFISFGQTWCNMYRNDALISSIRSGVHSPGQYRVIGSLQNSEDFARVFNCPSTSYMNAANKCQVW